MEISVYNTQIVLLRGHSSPSRTRKLVVVAFLAESSNEDLDLDNAEWIGGVSTFNSGVAECDLESYGLHAAGNLAVIDGDHFSPSEITVLRFQSRQIRHMR